jgi:hypothetical protein
MRSSGIIANYNSQFNAPGQHSLLLAGVGNQITGSYTERAIVAGTSNTINAADSNINNTLMGSDNSTIYVVDTADNNNLIHASSYSVISGKTRASMISTSGSTALYDDTLHTDNAHTFKTESFNVIAGGNVTGSASVDCTLGTIFTFTMTGNVSVDFLNPRVGQRFIFIVYNKAFTLH